MTARGSVVVHQGSRAYRRAVAGSYSSRRGVVILDASALRERAHLARSYAADAGLGVYRVDLRQVVSKYLGETEKNLKRAFAAARERGAVLLFDEAEALFGKRTTVKDAHDRYANTRIDRLLRRLDAAPCTVLLAAPAGREDLALARMHCRLVLRPARRPRLERQLSPTRGAPQRVPSAALGRLKKNPAQGPGE